ncbi:MAG: hypothetical protein J7524_16445 [Roseofilum sp. Belize BBD 4]|uniref:CheR family methyltransferase n=1 Tax=Roseofilum sp. Belize BBD 4 TaxID=2821500 RepID=UPI000E9ECD46|nr:CheR family methyltransferase [Roseofilum sp. Belize BBD 4]MBP0034735.1 hypothetical protein [Roseofilum sp. Belize BBD 4]HBQ99081.1 hypothetical protein [Cyanobacteria bacterium UBA11691]
MINIFLLEQLIQLINHKTGLAIRSKDRESLSQKVIHRTQCLRMSSVDDYYQLLATPSHRRDREWETLIDLLTTGESYFFRDRGQIQLLRTHLLPELINIQRHQAGDRDRPSFNVWSAGCSTGEEAYSLAILLMELIPDWRNWHLRVLGTDINAMAIAKAKTGLYNNWSFRLVEPRLKASYFKPYQELWKINPDIQQLVHFQTSNLILDSIPQDQGQFIPFDLVICRNVFIYLTKEAIDICLQKFCHALHNKGYFITSHTELYGHHLQCLQIKALPESIVYQKQCSLMNGETYSEQRKVPSFLHPLSQKLGLKFSFTDNQIPTKTSIDSHTSTLAKLQNNQPQKTSKPEKHPNFIRKNLDYLEEKPKDFTDLLSMAKSHANLGELDLAIQYAHECLSVRAFAIDPYYLLSQIAEEKGELEQAKIYLKRIIYLEPKSISAYLDLGSLYAQQGNKVQARKFWNIALDFLQKYPQDAKIGTSEEYTTKELLRFIKNRLKELQ